MDLLYMFSILLKISLSETDFVLFQPLAEIYNLIVTVIVGKTLTVLEDNMLAGWLKIAKKLAINVQVVS